VVYIRGGFKVAFYDSMSLYWVLMQVLAAGEMNPARYSNRCYLLLLLGCPTGYIVEFASRVNQALT
jgi:hypothetical protein